MAISPSTGAFYPFNTLPTTFLQNAENGQPNVTPGRQDVSSFGLSQPNWGPPVSQSHAMLLDKLNSSQQNNNMSGLMNQLIANPQLAQQLGGLTSQNYSPTQFQNGMKIDFNAPGGGGMHHGFGSSQMVPMFGANGAPTPVNNTVTPPPPVTPQAPTDPVGPDGLTQNQRMIAALLAGGGSGGGSANGNSGAAGGGSAGG